MRKKYFYFTVPIFDYIGNYQQTFLKNSTFSFFLDFERKMVRSDESFDRACHQQVKKSDKVGQRGTLRSLIVRLVDTEKNFPELIQFSFIIKANRIEASYTN